MGRGTPRVKFDKLFWRFLFVIRLPGLFPEVWVKWKRIAERRVFLKCFGRTTVGEFLGDSIVFRGLEPADTRLPGLTSLQPSLGLLPGRVPRKSETDYARVVVSILQEARKLEAPQTALQRLIFLGDTRMSDGTAFTNMCQVGGWPGIAFIGSEDSQPPKVELLSQEGGILYLSNRWANLDEFDRYCAGHGFPVDENTAIVVDMDKTTLGARGRNAKVIDAVRVQAVRETVAELMGPDFNEAAFRRAYEILVQVEFHPFTSDNQDYLAYICLILASGLYDLESILAQVRSGELESFQQFIRQVDAQSSHLGPHLAEIHRRIYANVRLNDPTPFKAFRRNEYRITVSRMGFLSDESPVERLLQEEILITQEVRQICLEWKARGGLLFGLSDKPDEASLPTPELEAQGYQPLHQTVTHALGE
jgi:hypothetical protein